MPRQAGRGARLPPIVAATATHVAHAPAVVANDAGSANTFLGKSVTPVSMAVQHWRYPNPFGFREFFRVSWQHASKSLESQACPESAQAHSTRINMLRPAASTRGVAAPVPAAQAAVARHHAIADEGRPLAVAPRSGSATCPQMSLQMPSSSGSSQAGHEALTTRGHESSSAF